ncbi:hypothetical protein ACFFPJ_00755, partial [Microbacterium terregens]
MSSDTTGDAIVHVAIEDDWEMSLPLGAYEAATRRVAYEPGGYIRATTTHGVQPVLDRIYPDLTLPLILVTLSVAGLEASGIPVEPSSGEGWRIFGAIPCTDDSIVVATRRLERAGDRWVAQ